MTRRPLLLAAVCLLVAAGPSFVTAHEDVEGVEVQHDVPVAGDAACTADLASASEEVAVLKGRVEALTAKAEATHIQLKKQISGLNSEIAALKQSVKTTESERDALFQDLQQTNNVLAALRLEQESSPVPASVVLFFAKLRPLQQQAQAVWADRVQPHASLAVDRARLYTAQARTWAATRAFPAWNEALHRGRALASDLHTRLASHETLGAHYGTLHRHVSIAGAKAQELYAQAAAHAARAATELETLLAAQLRRYPSTAPLAVKPYPAVIVKGLLWLPLVALVLSLLGAGKGKRSGRKAQNGTPRSAKKNKNKKH